MSRGLAGVLAAILTLAFPIEIGATPRRQLTTCGRPARQVIFVLMDGMSYEEALDRPGPLLPGGQVGIGLMTAGSDQELSSPQAYIALGAGGGKVGAIATDCAAIAEDPQSPQAEVSTALLGSVGGIGSATDLLGTTDLLVIPDGSALSPEDLSILVSSTPADEVMVLLTAPVRSEEMRARGDEVTPLIIATGRPDTLTQRCVPLTRCARGLTSDTTRRNGIVCNVDVAATVLDFLGRPIPKEVVGSPIRIEGERPTDLHRRYLEYQRIHTPTGLLALAAALLTLVVSVGVLLGWRRAPQSVLRPLALLALFSVALPVVMVSASLLPRLTYSLVLPTLAVGAALVSVVAVVWGRGDTVAPVAIVAGLGMGTVILDGVLGWPAMLMPLLGDSALEGVRFYGMGNAFAGVYMAGAILLAARIPPLAGMALLAAAGLLAGLPGFGAELGTSFTLFAAAGLWYPFRVRGRFGRRELVTAGAIALVGLAAILLIHRLSTVPTHVTRVVEEAERSGAGGTLSVFGRRLALNIRTTSATPAAWLVVFFLPVWLVVAWKRWGPFGRTLRRDPAWRDAAVVLAISAIIGFLVNDTIGVAGLGFTYLSASLVYPALREQWTSG